MAIVTGDDLQLYDPTLEQAEADRLAQLAGDAIEAWLEPVAVPDPAPKRMRMVAIAYAFRLAGAKPAGSGAVVSESLGSYTYRLARPLDLNAALQLPDDLAAELLGWAPHRQKVYSVGVQLDEGRPAWWPVDWWQRDLDNLDDPPASLAELPDYAAPAEG